MTSVATPIPRVQMPDQAKKGEVFQVKVLISHPMETGLRHDSSGKLIPRRIINTFICRYGGVDVLTIDLHESVSANPFFEFYLRAAESGRIEFIWKEDGGAVYALDRRLMVS